MEIDLSSMITESSNPRSALLDKMTPLEVVTLMNREDATVPKSVNKQLGNIAKAVELCIDSLSHKGRIIYIGAGTSGRLGVVDAAECPPTFGVSPDLVVGLIAGGSGAIIKAVEGAEDSRELGQKDLVGIGLAAVDTVIGLAASGRTPYVIGGLLYANSIGCNTVSVACNENSEIGKVAKYPIEVIVGPEVLTGSTRLKAGTAQKLVLNMISTATMVGIGKCYKNYMVDMMQSNEKLHVRAQNMVMTVTGVDRKEAKRVLLDAGGSVKNAIVMIMADCTCAEALARLEKSKGHVRGAIA